MTENKPMQSVQHDNAVIRQLLATCEMHRSFLFALLDDIDTAGDIAKADDKLYRSIVEKTHRRRFEVASTDGYSVTFSGSTPAITTYEMQKSVTDPKDGP